VSGMNVSALIATYTTPDSRCSAAPGIPSHSLPIVLNRTELPADSCNDRISAILDV